MKANKVKYKITTPFALYNYGDVISAYAITGIDAEHMALLYHPPMDKDECGSMEMAKLDRRDNCYKSISEEGYINLDGRVNKAMKKLFCKAR